MAEKQNGAKSTSTSKQTCFVIQPFDNGGKFDRRFDSTFSPAIKAAGLIPDRVDRNPASSIPINDIERGIRESACCFADISENNPNVWYELGYAFAAGKEVCMVCEATRQHFPFDVQHRNIIKYQSESASDWDGLHKGIVERLKAIQRNAQTRKELPLRSSQLAEHSDLKDYEVAVLICVAELSLNNEPGTSARWIADELARSGYERIIAKVGLESLVSKSLLGTSTESDDRGEAYRVYFPSPQGMKWLTDNLERFVPPRREVNSDIKRVAGDPPF